jgi:acyl-CoA synthetase (NDP forming)
MFGLGGIYVEVMKDISFRAWPIDRGEAMAMIKEIRSYPLLLGVRGEERKDIDGVIDTILRVGALLAGCPAVSDIEVNPLVVYDQGHGVKAVDMRILLYPPKGASHA